MVRHGAARTRAIPGTGRGSMPQADPTVVLDLAESRGMEEAAAFVVDLLDRPGSDIHVLAGQLGLAQVVLVDGSLHGGPLVPADVVRRAHDEAVQRGVALAGVVKASTLFWGRNAPLVTLLKRRGDRELGAATWAARISTDPRFGRLYVG